MKLCIEIDAKEKEKREELLKLCRNYKNLENQNSGSISLLQSFPGLLKNQTESTH